MFNLTKFLLGKASTPAIVDPNHNMKSLHYQVLGGPDIVTCCTTVINPQLLWDSGISEALYCVMDDWASNNIVLQLILSETLMSIHELLQQLSQQQRMSDAEYKLIAAAAYILYFMQLHLYCVNAKGYYSQSLDLSWSLCFNYLDHKLTWDFKVMEKHCSCNNWHGFCCLSMQCRTSSICNNGTT